MPVFEPEVVDAIGHEPAPVMVVATTVPIRTMPTISRLAVRTPDRPLTNAAEAARPVAVQRAAAAAAAAAAGTTTALPPASPGGMRRVPSPVAVTPTASREVSSPPHRSRRPMRPALSRSGEVWASR